MIGSNDQQPRAAASNLVTAALDLRNRALWPEEFLAVFDAATVYVRRPEHPGFFVAKVADFGRWIAVFSSLDQLGAVVGECDWLSTTGADLLAFVPNNVGVMLDPGSDHTVPLPPGFVRRARRTMSTTA